MIMLPCLTAMIIMVSCSGTPSTKYNIVTTEDWINHVSSASNVEEIDRGYSSMSPNQIANITEELSLMVINLKKGDVKAKAKCRAMCYLILLPSAHMGATTSDFVFTSSEIKRLDDVVENKELTTTIILMTLGDEAEQLYDSFLDYYASIAK